MSRTHWWLLFAAGSLCLSAATAEDVEPSEDVTLAQRVCGPRCVQWVLARYGIEADLVQLVRETQWPDFEAGASFHAMQAALERRGLFTQALKSPSIENWDVPIIIQERLAGEAIAHFAVIDPELGYWDPAILDFAERDMSRYTGHLLAVFESPPATPTSRWWVSDAVLAGSAAGLAGLLAYLIWRRSSRWTAADVPFSSSREGA